MDIRIIVATHKTYWMPRDPVYLPLQVGAAGKEKLGFQTDAEGDNISRYNPYYCELTGLYWAWKNLSCDVVGLCHYRRYFGHRTLTHSPEKKKKAIFHKKDYEALLREYDVIVPEKRHYYIESVRSQYEHAHHKRDLDLVEQIISQKYPAYKAAFEAVMDRRSLYLWNMFVMDKKRFDAYCTWLFDILFLLEPSVNLKDYSSYEARVFGFLAERLWNVWLEKQQLRKIEVPVIMLENVNWPRKIGQFLKRKFNHAEE